MGKKKGSKKSNKKMVKTVDAWDAIMKAKAKIGEHEIKTPHVTVSAISTENKGPHGDVRASFRLNGHAITKMALKYILDAVGRANGEETDKRKVVANASYKKFRIKNEEFVAKLLGQEKVEPEPAFTKKELKQAVKKKALKKAFKQCKAMFDKDVAKNILGGAFKGEKSATVAEILPSFGNTPSDDIKAVIEIAVA